MTQVLAAKMVSCMSGVDMPAILPDITSTAILLIKIAIPIGLIIFGMIDLGKAVIASKEDEIKKYQNLFIKRIIAAVLVFFVVSIVQLTFGILGSAESKGSPDDKATAGVNNCIDCFLNGSKRCTERTTSNNG